jgi:hypothetical protein
MKLEDVLEVLPMLILEFFLEQFVFIWGHEQCSKMFGQIYPRSYYYLKDLKRMHYNCRELPCGKEDQTLLIDYEPSKVFRNPKWSGLFLESFRGQMLLKNKVQWLDLASHFWPLLFELPLAKTIRVLYYCMVKYSKPCLNSYLKNYYWFVQYIDNDDGDVCNDQPPLGMESESFHFASYFFVITFINWYLFSFAMFASIDFCLQLVWTVVHKLRDNAYNFKREKTMLAIQVFILRSCRCGDIFDHG